MIDWGLVISVVWRVSLVIIVLVLLVIGVLTKWQSSRTMRVFSERRCAGSLWKQEFPRARAEEIREFLSIFAETFGIDKKHRLKFRPEDKVMEVYRALNPKWGVADSLELEFLAMVLEKKYRMRLERLLREGLRLGEVFGEARGREKARWW